MLFRSLDKPIPAPPAPPSYLWHGSAENQLLGIGNAVSTNVASDLMAAAVAVLN